MAPLHYFTVDDGSWGFGVEGLNRTHLRLRNLGEKNGDLSHVAPDSRLPGGSLWPGVRISTRVGS